MGAKRPHFVGIAGGSCSGKTWLAQRLQEILGKEAARLSLDDFYLDRAHLSLARRARVNFDHPRAIDWVRFEEVLRAFARGRETAVPKYNFANHAREVEEPVLSAKPVILVEGLWLYRRASVRRIFDRRIFLRLPEHVCASRRMRRDTVERGRNQTQVREQWNEHARPMYERFVAPQERWADLVLTAAPDEERVVSLAAEIRENLAAQFECL